MKLTLCQAICLDWLVNHNKCLDAWPQHMGYTWHAFKVESGRMPEKKYGRKGLKPQAAHRLGMKVLRGLERRGLVKVVISTVGRISGSHYTGKVTDEGMRVWKELGDFLAQFEEAISRL